MIYIGADHRGYQLKEQLKTYLSGRGYKLADLGTDSEESVDYPLIAAKVAEAVKEDPNNRGILLCGSGVGVCIVANKFKGIRAGEAWNADVARRARTDDNINILCISADTIELADAQKISQAFLDTSFAGEDRYKRRLKQIEEIENSN